MGEPRLTLLTRPGCHLCDVAKEAMERVALASGEAWHEVDISTDPELDAEYGDRTPSSCWMAGSTGTGGSRRYGCCAIC